MNRIIKWVAVMQVMVTGCFGVDYYLDSTAPGNGTGTSWATAWNAPASVDWNKINPGDTLYVSGGDVEKHYTDWLTIGKNGTANKYITVRIGQDPHHNGRAVFDGCGVTMKSGAQWNAIDGARFPESTQHPRPSNHREVLSGSTKITDNIGFKFQNITGQGDSDFSPVLWFFRSPNNLRFSYLEASGLTNNASFQYHETRGSVCYAALDSGARSTNIVFEYCYFHDNAGQVIGWSGDTAKDFDEKIFKFGWLPMNAEDHFETSGGWTIRDSVVGPCNGYSVHNDFFQFTGDYIKVYNNDIRESQNSIMRIQTYPDSGIGLRHDVYFFNNVVTEQEGRAPGGGTAIEPMCMVHYDPDHPASITTYSNIVFANNLFYNSILTRTVQPPRMCLNPVMTWTKGNVQQSYIKACYFINNIVVDKDQGLSFPVTRTAFGSDSYEPFTTNDFEVTYNVIAVTGSNNQLRNPLRIAYLDRIGDAGTGPYWFNNSTVVPAFSDPNPPVTRDGDYTLKTTDTVALGKGKDLSTKWPWLNFNFDALNRTRTAGAWDRGPLTVFGGSSDPNPQPAPTNSPPDTTSVSNLVAWITFNDDFSDSKVDDASGNGAHAYRFGRVGSVYPANSPASVPSNSMPGRTNLSSGDTAGKFDWFASNYGMYKREGSYLGITNVSRLNNMAKATIMVWARYERPHQGLDYSSDANATILSAGTAAGNLGSWDFGRYNQQIWMNNTRFYVTTNSANFDKSILEFPEDGWQDDTVKWRHYVVTWDNGLMIGYLDGKSFQTNNVSASVTRLQIGQNRNNPTPWIGIGTDTHAGTPPLDDEAAGGGIEYPNAGFMNGYIDDVRFYDRALTASEVQSVYATGSLPTGGEPPPPPPAKPAPPSELVVDAPAQ